MLRLNLHFIFLFFSFGFVDYFGPAYLYKMGYALDQITAYWLLFFVLRLLSRPRLLGIIHFLGIKRSFILAIALFSCRYLFYANLETHPNIIVVLLFFEAITSTFYWLLYHSTFAFLSSGIKTGGEVAWREVAIQAGKVLSPIVGASIIQFAGFYYAFILASVISVISLIPILKLPLNQFSIPALDWRQLLKSDRGGFWIYAASGLHEYGHNFIWKIVLFLYLGSYLSYGSLLSLAVAFQIAGTFFMGQRFDKGKGRTSVILGLACMLTALLSRATQPLSITFIIFLDLIMMLATVLANPFIAATCYSRSKRSGNPLWFQFLAESGWDMGVILALASSTVLLKLGIDLRDTILCGAFGVLGIALALRRYAQKDSKTSLARA